MQIVSREPKARFLAILVSLILPAIAAPGLLAQSYTWEHLAGSVGGAGALDLQGTAARFNDPWGIACDSAGNVYVVDSRGRTIRKISPYGELSSLAGNDGSSFQFEGRRTDVFFSNPRELTIDPAGNLYMADSANYVVRKITPAGQVTAFAGSFFPGSADGTGSGATFNRPTGIAFHAGSGNLYVSDIVDHTIRKITAAGVVTTFAGLAGSPGSANGTGDDARFFEPEALATDTAGNIYVADTRNHTIRKVTSTGVVTTLAGLAGQQGFVNATGGDARFSQPRGLVTDPDGNLYVADSANHRIRKITPGGVVTTFAGIGTIGHLDDNFVLAQFNQPFGIARDATGVFYVAEIGNDSIRRISTDGIVTTLAGKGAVQGTADGTGSDARFRQPRRMAVDPAGNLYVADENNQTIRKINTTTAQVTTFAGTAGAPGFTNGTGSAARFLFPTGLSSDGSGNLYVADSGAHTIRKIDPDRVVTTLAGAGGVSGTTNATGANARFNRPVDTATDASGNVFVADASNHAIRMIDSGAVVTTLAGMPGTSGAVNGTGTAARFNNPTGVAVDGSGNVYVADRVNHAIRKITPGGLVTTFAGEIGAQGSNDGPAADARFVNPLALAFDPSGNLIVSEENSGTIRRITPGGVVTTIGGAGWSLLGNQEGTGSFARFWMAGGVASDASGTLYVSDAQFSTIRVGRPALNAAAAIDQATGDPWVTRQLSTSPNPGSSWQWDIIRRPAGSTAEISSPTISNPTFTPDVPDVYVFRLDTSSGSARSITHVTLTSPCPTVTPFPSSLDDPLKGVPYNESVIGTGGTDPYTFSLAGGALPPGLTLSAGGTISGTPGTSGNFTFTVSALDAFACPGEREYTLTVRLPAPTDLVAIGSSSSAALSWNPVSGATGYRVYRKTGALDYAPLGNPATNSFDDDSASASSVYAYFVRAFDGTTIESADSNVDLAATHPFPAIVAGTTEIHASHFTLMRQMVTDVRELAEVPAMSFTNSSLAGVPVKAIHLTELRGGLDEARIALGMSEVGFTNPSPSGVEVRAVHVNQIVNGMR